MDNFGFNEMQEIQKELQEKYKDEWGGLSPKELKKAYLKKHKINMSRW